MFADSLSTIRNAIPRFRFRTTQYGPRTARSLWSTLTAATVSLGTSSAASSVTRIINVFCISGFTNVHIHTMEYPAAKLNVNVMCAIWNSLSCNSWS
jgi:hypothetical protein